MALSFNKGGISQKQLQIPQVPGSGTQPGHIFSHNTLKGLYFPLSWKERGSTGEEEGVEVQSPPWAESTAAMGMGVDGHWSGCPLWLLSITPSWGLH